jgi:TolB-like protein
MLVRIGIHVGDVVERCGDIFGDAVNVASRIYPLAEPGEICLTEEVFLQVRNKVPYAMERLPEQSLKHVDYPMAVYRVLLSSRLERSAGEAPPKNRLAILPFANISPDPKDEYFADGMTEELISTVSKVRKLQVISRTSVSRYKGGGKSVGEIGRELNVGAVLEGSVRKVGDKVRIAAQLIDVQADQHLWSETYDRGLEDVFGVQSEIASRVAKALEVQLLGTDAQAMKKGTESTEAYVLYLKGRYFWNKRTLEWYHRAIEQFEKAIEKDAGYALAYSGLADCHLIMGRWGYVPPAAAYPKAKQYALKAIELDEDLAEPHAALGAVLSEYEYKWSEGEREFKRSIELNPSYATAHNWYALCLGHVGRLGEAIEEIEKAHELDPLSAVICVGGSEEYLFAGLYDMAIEAARRALELDPNFGHGSLGAAYTQKGMYGEAIAELKEDIKCLGGTGGELGYAYAISGRREDAMKVLTDLNAGLEKGEDYEFAIGQVYIGLGEKEEALRWLEKAYEKHVGDFDHLKCDPLYGSVRGEPRFRELMKKVGLAW